MAEWHAAVLMLVLMQLPAFVVGAEEGYWSAAWTKLALSPGPSHVE